MRYLVLVIALAMTTTVLYVWVFFEILPGAKTVQPAVRLLTVMRDSHRDNSGTTGVLTTDTAVQPKVITPLTGEPSNITETTLPRSSPDGLLSAIRDFFKDNPGWK